MGWGFSGGTRCGVRIRGAKGVLVLEKYIVALGCRAGGGEIYERGG